MAFAEQPRIKLNAAFLVTAAIATTGSLALCIQATSFYAGLFFVPFAFGPLVITVILSFALRSRSAQVLLATSSVLYAAWFGYIYADAFYLNPDPQSPIAFLFIGVYAVPVLVVFWIAAGVSQWRSTRESDNQTVNESR